MEPIANNQTKPNQTQTTPTGARGGVNRGRVEVKQSGRFPAGHKSEAEKRSSERLARAVEWARSYLPGESRTCAVSAFLSERHRLKRDPSVDEVRARLVATGRDAGSIDPKVLAAERSWCEARGI